MQDVLEQTLGTAKVRGPCESGANTAFFRGWKNSGYSGEESHRTDLTNSRRNKSRAGRGGGLGNGLDATVVACL